MAKEFSVSGTWQYLDCSTMVLNRKFQSFPEPRSRAFKIHGCDRLVKEMDRSVLNVSCLEPGLAINKFPQISPAEDEVKAETQGVDVHPLRTKLDED